jgi:hypothetical protein
VLKDAGVTRLGAQRVLLVDATARLKVRMQQGTKNVSGRARYEIPVDATLTRPLL